jgi:alanine racemase
VARTLERAGAHGFCVALLEEGIELREAGIRAPILVMGGYYGDAYHEVIERKMIPVVYDMAQAEGFARLVRSAALPGPIDVHLKLDTGMARLGVPVAQAAAFAAELAEYPEVRVAGLMTHLACADAASTADLDAQMIRFDEATARLSRHGIRPDVRHAANSAALLRGAAKLDWARPGVALFGVSPRAVGEGGALQDPFVSDLQPVMRVRTEIVALRPVPTGERIGYGGLWTAARPSIIATIPMGYADGLSRHLTNRGAVLVRGTRAPIAGAVSMDLTMIDVTDVLGVQLRDEVVVLGEQEGPQGVQLLGADEVAGWGGTIPWEVMTQISRRVPRFYREP